MAICTSRKDIEFASGAWRGAVLFRLLLVEVARAYFVVVAVTRGRELRLGVGICIGIVDAALSTVSVRVLLAVGAVCLRVGVVLVLVLGSGCSGS